jgi:hypothetical protein
MLVRKPSRTVTADAPTAFAVEPPVVPDEGEEEEEEEEQPASTSAAPIIAAAVIRRIKVPQESISYRLTREGVFTIHEVGNVGNRPGVRARGG